ncbi:MAG: fused MFS/spermidine synthase [Alphaproteobacteria bacterium]|nr:fused MFS/spermidine synthase [Alphaproteobacteria bacterium]
MAIQAEPQGNEARRAAGPLFASVMFASAALIFLLQPMFSRMVTPLLGGSPAVWNTSMVFFQGALLIGYVYAHRLARLKSLQTQLYIHAGVIAVACVTLFLVGGGLKIVVSDALGAPDTRTPIMWLLGVLTLSVGLPYAAISATAPLLQSWYARTGRSDAHDPYHLYAASNLGSLLGLAAYPVIVEPLLGISAQSASWATGFLVVGVAIIGAGYVALRSNGISTAESDAAAPTSTWGDRLFWMAAAAAPSSLMLGVTSHISTDVASAPFLWVIPLALYLLTFVFAFGKNADAWRDPVALLQPISLAALIVAYTQNEFVLTLSANLVCFFLSALVCHLALSARRPPVGRLTEFYMWVSIGGVLGGAATALLAPVIFNDVFEYPLALAAVALFLPRRDRPLPQYAALAIGIAAIAVALIRLFWQDGEFVRVWEPGAVGISDWGQFGGIILVGLLVLAAGSEPEYSRPASIGVAAILGATGIVQLLTDQNGIQIADVLMSAGIFGFGLLVLLAHRRQIVREIVAIMGFVAAAAVLAVFLARRFGLPEWLPVNPDLRVNIANSSGFEQPQLFMMLGVIAVGILTNRSRPILAAGLVLAAFLAVNLNGADRKLAFQGRSFFGVTRVVEYPNLPDGTLRVMMHGTTIHGAQYVTGERTRDPLTYYHPDTGLGRATQAALARFPQGRLGLIGLGSGSTACLKRPQDTLTIFEIDPMVVRFSTQSGVFTFVPQCAPDAKIVLGDARLGVQDLPDNALDVLVVDAFSSDAVPAHLLTKEAIALYLRKLSPTGVVILHLSNRNLDLVGEASMVVREGGFGALWASTDSAPSADYYTSFATSVMVVTRDQATANSLLLGPDWYPIEDAKGRAWSDEYINMVRPLLSSF